MMVIASRLPGRLRLRGSELRSPARHEAVMAELGGWDGVVELECNPAAGSLVVRYDTVRLAPADLEARLAGWLGMAGPAPAPRRHRAAVPTRRINRAANYGMMASLALSLLGLAAGKGMHAAAGVVYLAFLAAHLAIHRRNLVR